MDIRQIDEDFLQPILSDIRAVHQHLEEIDAAKARMQQCGAELGSNFIAEDSPLLHAMRNLAAKAKLFAQFQKRFVDRVTELEAIRASAAKAHLRLDHEGFTEIPGDDLTKLHEELDRCFAAYACVKSVHPRPLGDAIDEGLKKLLEAAGVTRTQFMEAQQDPNSAANLLAKYEAEEREQMTRLLRDLVYVRCGHAIGNVAPFVRADFE